MALPIKLEKAMFKKIAGGLGGGLAAAASDLGAAAMSAGVSALGVGGMMPVVWGPDEFHFRFNPSDLSTSKSVHYERTPVPNDKRGNRIQYKGNNPSTLTIRFLLDEWEAPPGVGQDVHQMVNALFKLTMPVDPQNHESMPDKVMFLWGSVRFTGYITDVKAAYKIFSRSGTPLRAELDVSMVEHVEGDQAQNPTSGGPPGRRDRTLIEGDNLQTLSYREYGDPNLWRAIAEANGIDDPLAVAPGTTLLLPSKSDAQAYR
jgi:hypothetical protein